MIRKTISLIFLGSILLNAAVQGSSNEQVSLPNKIILSGESEIYGKKKVEFEFPPLDPSVSDIHLFFKARIDNTSVAGSTMKMKIEVNDKLLSCRRTNRTTRLMNKSEYIDWEGKKLQWFNSDFWRIVYASDFESANNDQRYNGQAYNFNIDISDLVSSVKKNKIKISVAHLRSADKLILKDLSITSISRKEDKTVGSVRPEPRLQYVLPSLPGYSLKVTDAGAIELEIENKKYFIETQFLFFGGESMILSETSRPDNNHKISVSGKNGGFVIKVENKYCCVIRRVKQTKGRINITDSFTNLSGKPVGVRLKNFFKFDRNNIPPIWLAGNEDPSLDSVVSSGNPSVFISCSEQTGIGLLAWDNILRNHSDLYIDAENGETGFKDNMLLLKPGKPLDLNWMIFCITPGHYWNFVNYVKKNMNLSFTVPGSWAFMWNPDFFNDMSDEELAKKIERLDVKTLCLGVWIDPLGDKTYYGGGLDVMGERLASYRDRLRKAIERIHRIAPGTKVLPYLSFQRDSSPDAEVKLKDSLVFYKNKGSARDKPGAFQPVCFVYPSLINSYGNGMLKVIDGMLELGADGLYIDEASGVTYDKKWFSYNRSDGVSAIIDEDSGEIIEEVGFLNILEKDFMVEFAKRLKERGKIWMGNGPPGLVEMAELHVPMMVEAQHNDIWCRQNDFYSSLGFMSGNREYSAAYRLLGLGVLPLGTLLNYEYDVLKYLFPFTPIEIYPGLLKGKERIITLKSGAFSWKNYSGNVKSLKFDCSGKITDNTFVIYKNSEGETAVDVSLNPGEAAILIRDEGLDENSKLSRLWRKVKNLVKD